MTDREIDARRRLRSIQVRLGHLITPALSILIGDMWRKSLASDPEGYGLNDLVDSIEELITPMKN